MPKKKRECGDCQECCFTFGIEEYDSDPWTRCSQQCDEGCSVYENRPKVCHDYLCHWVTVDDDPFFTEETSPDKTGLVFAVGDYKYQRIWVCFESKPGAAMRSPGKDLIDKLKEKYLVKICKYGNTRKLVELTSLRL